MHGHSLLTVQIVKFSQLGHKSYQCSEWKLEEGGGTDLSDVSYSITAQCRICIYIYLSLQCLHSHSKGLKTRHIKKKINMWIEMLHGHTYTFKLAGHRCSYIVVIILLA